LAQAAALCYRFNLGWDVYSFDHEDAQGQFETDFAYCDALKMADRLTLFSWPGLF
jgi:glutamine synthetase